MFGIRRLRVLKVLLTALILICFCAVSFITPENSYAATVRTIPDSSVRVSQNTKLTMNMYNYSAKWIGVSGKIVTTSGAPRLCVPAKSNKAFTYNDFLELTFTNIGSINGRQLDAKVHFDEMRVSAKYSSATSGEMAGYVGVGSLTSNGLWLSTALSSDVGYRARKEFDITTTIYWHDTGQTVNLPFFQCLRDLDTATEGVYNEGWEALSGYSGIFYKYKESQLVFSGNKVYTPVQNPTDDTTDESLLVAGFYAPTTGGKFSCTFIDGSCATMMILYNAYAITENPVKTSSAKAISEEGDNITYTVKKRIGKFYQDTMTTYNSFSIRDTLPSGVTYQSASVKKDGKNISSAGTLTHNPQTGVVSFSFNKTWLSAISNYNGGEITLTINAKVKKPSAPKVNIVNTATAVMDGISLDSNKTTNVAAIPYKAKYQYVSGTSNRKLPDFIDTDSGEYAVSDSGVYYAGNTVARKSAPADGTRHEVYDADGNYKGVWTLSWDKASQTVTNADVVFTGTWTYTPAPRMNIVKAISDEADQFTAAHGEPVFLFKITGNTSGKTWYKSIRFSDEALEAVKTDGEYTDDTGTQFAVRDGKIYALAKTFYIPEDDYTVEEIETSRFEAVSSEARYHGEETVLIGKGVDSIIVPLKLSEYEAGAAGHLADYASVMFDNSKTKWNCFSHFDSIVNKFIN